MNRVMTPRPATEAQKRILARAAKNKNGMLVCPENQDVRVWMTALTQMSKKGYIYRYERVAYITDAGRAVLVNPPARRLRAGPARFWERAGAFSEVLA
jgi:L-amino acid N-acyltransferase YncA